MLATFTIVGSNAGPVRQFGCLKAFMRSAVIPLIMGAEKLVPERRRQVLPPILGPDKSTDGARISGFMRP